MTPRRKLAVCLAANVAILSTVIVLTTVFADASPYWRIGYNDELIVISVKINTAPKYAALLTLIAFINMSRVIVEEIGMPILGFSIYNPDKKVIVDFGKNELQFYANAMFTVSGLRGVMMTVISITQIDLAVWSLLVSEVATIYTIRLLLNEKTFPASTKSGVAYTAVEVVDVGEDPVRRSSIDVQEPL